MKQLAIMKSPNAYFVNSNSLGVHLPNIREKTNNTISASICPKYPTSLVDSKKYKTNKKSKHRSSIPLFHN